MLRASRMNDNPLLEITIDPPFDKVRPDHIRPAIDALLSRASERLAAISSLGEPRTFANTLVALDESTRELEWAMAIVGHLEAVMNEPALRDAYNAVQPKVSEFYSKIPLDEGLWRAVSSYAQTDDARALTGPRKRFLEKTLDGFRRQGAALAPHGKQRLAEIATRLSELTTRFSQNVLDSHAAFDLVLTDERRLAGLPPTALAMARESARSKGLTGYRFTLQAPSYLAVLTYAEDAALRETLWRAYNTSATRAPYDNQPLLGEILALRREQATLLGFKDFADYVLADRMAKDGATAARFVDDLREKTEPFFEREKRELLAFRREVEGPSAPALAPWDVAFYAEKMRLARYAFDEEMLRPYFEANAVVRGMFEVIRRVYGVEARKRADVEGLVYHKDVEAYSLWDGDRELCRFTIDLYPRENKRDGAWMNAMLSSLPGEGPQVGLFCANVTPATAERPALLTFREVETLFHEFGHLLHHALSDAPIRGMVGTRVAWDFVELPSQIHENWCWQREALDLFARHYATNEPLPEELFQKMKRARTFREATAQMRQLSFATVDLELHRRYDPAVHGSVVAFARDVMARFAATPLPEDYAMIASFNHLFADPVGYAAGYYSYKWAEVLDADAFTRFEREGIFNRATGDAFRDWVLRRGDSEDPAALFRGFMGRDPTVDALLARIGLTSSSGSTERDARAHR
jgi:oligopeptidase A